MSIRAQRSPCRPAVLLITAAAVAACVGEPQVAPDVVLRFASHEISYRAFEEYLEQSIGEPGSGLSSKVLSKLFDQFVDEHLLAQMAVDQGSANDLRNRRAAVGRLIADQAAEVEPTERMVATYYEDHHDEFSRPERVRLAQILVEDRESAESAATEIDRGADFAAVARTVSIDPTAAMGGIQGELSREDLPPAFAQVIFALDAGGVSEIVPADYGFHVFKVLERLPAEQLPLVEVEDEIRSRLRRERSEANLDTLLAAAHDRYDPRVYQRNLPFNYQGRLHREEGL